MDDGSRRRQQQQRRGSPAAPPGRPRTVPIAVTPEGFWCCPSPAALHKSLLKNPHHHGGGGGNKQSPAPPHKTLSAPPSRAPSVQAAPSVTDEPAPAVVLTDDDQQQSQATAEVPAPAPAGGQQEPPPPQQQHKVCVGFGRPETSDLTVMLYGKEGIAVRMSVHRDVLCQSSAFFAQRLAAAAATASGPADAPPAPSCVEIHDCDDAEIYVETVGLMYCDEAKHRLLLKQSVPRVLRIMRAADALGFHGCVASCLDYLEAVPWVGDEEERSVVSSVRRLQSKDDGGGCCRRYGGVSPLLKRIASDCLKPPSDTFAGITEMVLTSTDERGRREMKALVLNLLKDRSRSHVGVAGGGSPPESDSDISSSETLYGSCRGCLDRLRRLFADASSSEYSPAVTRRIALETDNLLWLVELLASQRACDGFVALWSGQAELAASHARVPAASRHAVSRVTARLLVGVGRGELLPPRDARLRLLQVWLQPLIDDYAWLQRDGGGGGGGGGSRPSASAFDRRLVEDGIGQTILTLPLEDQRSMLLAWFGRFLKLGDDCPNLQRAFEVWWRTFVRPYVCSSSG